jgi:hypothetical protein
VISERRLAANRRNAARSTGPRTQAGKIRSRRNALRHGLAAVLADHGQTSPKAEELAELIVGGRPGSSARYYAREAAFAELDILRARAERVALFDSLAPHLSLSSSYAKYSFRKKEREAAIELFEWQRLALLVTKRRRLARKIALACHEEHKEPNTFVEAPDAEQVAKAILKLDRYEQRAFARRDRALRQLDAVAMPTTNDASF